MQPHKNRLYTYGFNAYQQLGSLHQTKVIDTHTNISQVLMATWESTFILTDQNVVELWGYKNALLDSIVAKWNNSNTIINCIFGDLNIGLGTVDSNGNAYWWSLQGKQEDIYDDGILLATNIKQAGLCQEMKRLYLLSVDGEVLEHHLDDLRLDQQLQSNILTIPRVFNMAMSATHVLFAVEGMAPVYGLGSNRMGQLAMDMGLTQQVNQPTIVDFFSGLGTMNDDGEDASSTIKVACGPFHSAVIIHQDLYTFGWNDSGRLGWGSLPEDDNDSTCSVYDSGIKLASFIDNGCELDILANKVCCGSAHTVVIGDDGSAWTCGSGKYLQLGRKLEDENKDGSTYDEYFRRCSEKNKVMIDCQAGPWSTLLLERQ